jgi:energy-coupling factor transporter ATP-binding protein EcfA2
MLSPYHLPQQQIIDVTQRIVPLSTFIGGFPFASSGYNDGIGTWFAMDAHGGMIVLDLWKRGGDRTNSNIVILGHSGQGKSTAIKNIILSEYMMGTKVIIVDPEHETKDLCHNLNGDWINCGGGKGGRINPLQVKPAPKDDEEEQDKLYVDEGNGMGDLALHMKTLDIFFNLYLPTLTDIQKALLKECLIELYNDFGITWDTDVSKLTNDDFPTFSDLYELINKKAKENKNTVEYETLSALLHDIAVGSDSFLWNGITTLKSNSKIICLDTHDLQNTEDKIKRTQYFNILGWAWEQMSRNRTEKVLLVADEAYLMIDPNVPQSLVFLRNVAKRARKYESGIAIISHSLVDFLDPSVRMYGQPLLDMPSYKIIMGCDGRDLEDIIELYHLTDAEQELDILNDVGMLFA